MAARTRSSEDRRSQATSQAQLLTRRPDLPISSSERILRCITTLLSVLSSDVRRGYCVTRNRSRAYSLQQISPPLAHSSLIYISAFRYPSPLFLSPMLALRSVSDALVVLVLMFNDPNVFLGGSFCTAGCLGGPDDAVFFFSLLLGFGKHGCLLLFPCILPPWVFVSNVHDLRHDFPSNRNHASRAFFKPSSANLSRAEHQHVKSCKFKSTEYKFKDKSYKAA